MNYVLLTYWGICVFFLTWLFEISIRLKGTSPPPPKFQKVTILVPYVAPP